MASDLHTRLLAAVQQRMDVARAADVGADVFDGTGVVVMHALTGMRSITLPSHIARFLAANDPATVLRHCERDLRVLERHAEDDGYCKACCAPFVAGEVQEATWPCAEITDLAAAYGIDP